MSMWCRALSLLQSLLADIVGDQLTGRSTAHAYRRQLLCGLRHLEIDCWNGRRSNPIVTHGESAATRIQGLLALLQPCSHSAFVTGHTFCTVTQFEEVALAIGESAFITTELPVVLSLEMHCSPKQQRILAQMMAEHIGDLLMRVSMASTGHNTACQSQIHEPKRSCPQYDVSVAILSSVR